MPPTTGPGSRGKPATRRTLLSRRDGLTETERVDKSARIAEAAIELLEERLPAGAIVALYAAKGSEVDPAAIDAAARAAGLVVVYPRVVDHDRVLAFHRATLEELVVGRFGLREPAADARAVAIEDVAAFVIPGLAFDRGGGRIGWGHGHYDATLALARPEALRIGLAFDCQIVGAVPRDAHDALLHVIISEAATHLVAEG